MNQLQADTKLAAAIEKRMRERWNIEPLSKEAVSVLEFGPGSKYKAGRGGRLQRVGRGLRLSLRALRQRLASW